MDRCSKMMLNSLQRFIVVELIIDSKGNMKMQTCLISGKELQKFGISVLPKGFDQSEGFFTPSAARHYPRARSAQDLKGAPGVLPREKNVYLRVK